MRDIEFRAWDLVKEKMLHDQREIYYYLGSTDEERATQRPHIFMQLTGLKDSEGKQIFEGDILVRERGSMLRGQNWNEVKAVVRFVEEHGGYCWADWRLDENIASFGTVIGNMYENANLL